MGDIIDVDALSDVDPDILEQRQLEEAIALSLSESHGVIDTGDDNNDVPRVATDHLASDRSTHEAESRAPVSDFIRERKLLEEARLQRRKRQLGGGESDIQSKTTEPPINSSSKQYTEPPAKRQ